MEYNYHIMLVYNTYILILYIYIITIIGHIVNIIYATATQNIENL